MRIADKMAYDQVTSNLSKNRSDMAELQNQAATQKRLTKPSIDPLAATRVLATRTEIAGGQQFLKSIGQARAFLEYSDQSLSELAEILMRAKELAISQANDASASKNTREVAAAEVEQLFSQAVQVGNRKHGDRFLFGGFKTTRAPFDANGQYKGDDGLIKIAINKEATVAMNMPGSRIFLGKNVEVPRSVGPDAAIGPTRVRDPQPEQGRDGLKRTLGPDSTEPHLRGPASEPPSTAESDSDDALLAETWKTKGVNVFRVLEGLETGLKANDKESIQESMDSIDEAIAQVVLARAQLGSRVGTLNAATDSLSKGQVDAKGLASNLEDADTFELVSEINKTESTLKAALATSGKLIQPSLLDFLR